MENTNFHEFEPDTACEGVCKSVSKCIDDERIDRIYPCLCDRKMILRNSSKLKGQIHSQVNNLIEILRERERELCLRIDESNLDYCDALHHIAELCSCAHNESSPPSACFYEDEESGKVHSTTFLNSRMEFDSNFDQIKSLLERFGEIKKVECSSKSSRNDFKNILNDSSDEQAIQALYPDDIGEKLKECMEKSKNERTRNDSFGSLASFEVIDPCDEYQQIAEGHEGKDAEVTSDFICTPSASIEYPILLRPGLSFVSPEPQHCRPKTRWVFAERLREVLNSKKRRKIKKETKTIWPPADCGVSPPPDPSRRLSMQLKEMMVSEKTSQNVPNLDVTASQPKDANNLEARSQSSIMDPLISNSVESQSSLFKIESIGSQSEIKPVPSAIIQKNLENYLAPNSPDKWLAPNVKSSQPAINSDSHLFST